MAQITRSERIQAFLFLLIGLVVTAGVILILVGLRWGDAPRTYYLRFSEAVTGLAPGAAVRYKGVKYGRVHAIGVAADDPEIIRVTLKIDQDAPIRVSTTAVLAAESILGPYHIELRGSRSTSPLLPPDSYIPASATTLAKLLATGETLGDQLVTILANLQRWTSDTHREQFFSAIVEAEKALYTTREVVNELHPEVRLLLKTWTETGLVISDLLVTQRPHLERLIGDLSASARHLREVLDRGLIEDTSDALKATLDQATADLERATGAFVGWLENNPVAPYLDRATVALESLEREATGQLRRVGDSSESLVRRDLAPTLQELRTATAAMARLVALLERDPRALVFGASPEPLPLPGGQRR